MANQESQHILLVEDDAGLRQNMLDFLSADGHNVSAVSCGEEALELLDRHAFDFLITAMSFEGMDGHTVIEKALAVYPEIVPIALAVDGTVESAVHEMKCGAYDYLLRPFQLEALGRAINQAVERLRLREESARAKSLVAPKAGPGNIIGKSRSMLDIFEFIETIARTSSTVLITGETGTGKELVAKAIHSMSPRRDQKLVIINCGAIPENLLESELFGHVKGAFTGAHQTRIGRFEQAHKGTIVLDEIGNMSVGLQIKLLRVLQEREFERVGGMEKIKVDVRIMASTSANLREMSERNEFRSDLYYRLNVIPVHVPGLRERREDVPLLTAHFIAKCCALADLPVKTMTQRGMKMLMNYNWPGNVRELENAIERAVALSGTRTLLSARDLPLEVQSTSHNLLVSEVYIPDEGVNFNTEVSALERQLILQSLKKTGGNKREAAQLLQLKRTTLIEKVRRLNMSDAADAASFEGSA